MSKLKVSGNASGTGVITLEAPNTNTDRTITLPDGDISLGVGIDDNATSTRLTVADTGITSNAGQHGLGNNLEATNVEGGAFSISDPDAYSIQDYLRIGSDTSTTAGVSELQISSYGSSGNAGGGSVRFYNTRYANDVALVKGTRNGANTGKLDFYVESSGLQKQLTIDSDGLKFNGDTAAANALDDYETGTWDAAFLPSSGSITVNPSYDLGHYTKIGNTVFVSIHIRASSVSSPTGNLYITGLPYSSLSGTEHRTAFSINPNYNLSFPSGSIPNAYLTNGSSQILVCGFTGSNVVNAASYISSGSELYISGTYITA